MTGPLPRPVRRIALVATAAVVCLAALAGHADGVTIGTDDPSLDQTIAPDQQVVTGPATIRLGHVDVGPRFVDGAWTLLVHDDSGSRPVWRSLDETVIQVGDAALLTVPDNPAYTFLGTPAWTKVHVVPQTQNPAVVWMGWNTQDPEVIRRLDRGATLTLRGVEGPGELHVYLQSGNLTEPDVLWQSTRTQAQPIWIDVNGHTHANWIFTEPGSYLVRFTMSADLVDGTAVADTRTLRFAVGDSTSVEATRAARYSGPEAPLDDEAAASDSEPADSGISAGVVAAIAAAVVLLGAGLVVVLVRGASVRRRAEAEGP